MACPRCGSNKLWDDNLSWGCDSCGYMETAGRGSFLLAKDKPELPRSLDEMRRRGPAPEQKDIPGPPWD